MDFQAPPLNVPQVNIAPYGLIFIDKAIAFVPVLLDWFKSFLGFLIGMSLVASVFFLMVIIYCVERMKVIRQKENQIYENPVVPIAEPAQAGDAAMARRWEDVKKHIESSNQNDWRQAIIEADIILDDLLSRLGYRGATVGDKLKRAHTGDFSTLGEAWEGHKVRNQIAHEGAQFELNHLEARRAIDNYRKVFEEFYFIS